MLKHCYYCLYDAHNEIIQLAVMHYYNPHMYYVFAEFKCTCASKYVCVKQNLKSLNLLNRQAMMKFLEQMRYRMRQPINHDRTSASESYKARIRRNLIVTQDYI